MGEQLSIDNHLFSQLSKFVLENNPFPFVLKLPAFLEKPENRGVVTVAMNLLHGAARLMRARWLGAQGIDVPAAAGEFKPRRLEELARV